MNHRLIEFSIWIEWIALSLEAGLDLMGAIKEIIKIEQRSWVGRQFELLLSQTKYGKTRHEAFDTFKKQWKHPIIDQFCLAMEHAWKHGISLSDLLREQATHIQTEVSHRIEKEIHKKQLKLLMPLFLLLLPAVMIVLFIPMLLQLTGDPLL